MSTQIEAINELFEKWRQAHKNEDSTDYLQKTFQKICSCRMGLLMKLLTAKLP